MTEDEKCTLCEGTGEVQIDSPSGDNAGTFGCPCCMQWEHHKEVAKLQKRIEKLEAEPKERPFPVITHEGYDGPLAVNWSDLNEEWAMRNHNLTLERLCKRGGLGPLEIYANVYHLPLRTLVQSDNMMKKLEEAVRACKRIAFQCG